MAQKIYDVNRVKTLPTTGLVNGDQYLLQKSNGRFELYVVAPNLQLIPVQGVTDEELNRINNDYTNSQLDQKFNDIERDVLGKVTTSQTLVQLNALPDGIYEAQTSGAYANGITAKSGYTTKFEKVGTTWTLFSEVLLPTATGTEVLNPTGESIPKEKAVANWVLDKVLTDSNIVTVSTIPLPSASVADVSLIQNTPSPSDGFLSELSIRHITKTGVCKFQIFDRITNNFPNPNTGNAETFKGGQVFTINKIAVGNSTHDVSALNIEIKEGQYLGWVMDVGDSMNPCFGGTDNVPAYGRWQVPIGVNTNNATASFTKDGSVAFGYKIKSVVENYVKSDVFNTALTSIESDIDILKEEIDPTPTVIVATRNANNYNSIRDIVKGISDASKQKPYEVFVPNGEWFEYDILGKGYVTIICESDKTVIYCDGTSTNPIHTVPADAYYVTTGAITAGTQLASVNKIYKHTYFATKDLKVVGGTHKAIDCKYVLHADHVGFKEVSFEGVNIESVDCSYPIGSGVKAGQLLKLKNYRINDVIVNQADSRRNGVFMHNASNQPSSIKGLILENGLHYGCGIATLSDLGSDHRDFVDIINVDCPGNINEIFIMTDTQGSGAGITTQWTNPLTGVKEPDPKKVPYCIYIRTWGTSIELVYDRPATRFAPPYNTGTERPEFYKYMTSDYVCKIKPKNSSGIVKGDIIVADASTKPTIQKFIGAKISNSNNTEIRLGIALEDAQDGEELHYAPLNKYALTWINSDVAASVADYNRYKLKIVSGKLESDYTLQLGSVDAMALEPKLTGLALGYAKLNVK